MSLNSGSIAILHCLVCFIFLNEGSYQFLVNTCKFFVCSHPAVLRTCSWLCAQELHLVMLMRPYMFLALPCKTSALLTVISSWYSVYFCDVVGSYVQEIDPISAICIIYILYLSICWSTIWKYQEGYFLKWNLYYEDGEEKNKKE